MHKQRVFILRMAIFVGIVIALCAVLGSTIGRIFMANPVMNGVIIGALIIGIVYIFRQVLVIVPDLAWLERHQSDSAREEQRLAFEPMETRAERGLNFLAPLAAMMAERRGRLAFTAVSLRSVLDGIGARLDESRELARYMIGLMIFLGLLGTFWGLLGTVNSVGDVINGLTMSGQDINVMFGELKSGLEKPLSGMGTAFSSSLFGLASSLILGFLELTASQAQNRFYNELEDWLSSFTRLGGSSAMASEGGEQSVPAYVAALLEKTADSLDDLQRTLVRGEETKQTSGAGMLGLSERLATLTDQMRTQQDLMVKLVEGQMQIRPVLERLAASAGQGGMDEASRGHLRNLDVYGARLLEEVSQGRAQSVQEIRNEIRLLARTIAAIAEEEQRR
ncbi:MAG: flagellar motor protein MotA [Alphaproteobacteria bacterium]|nr:flagellar motor protein MotA [Alphaproteobacteria bacterium]